ncbi:MAG: phage coat protein, partial [Alphaproteobacteria bacterium]|nr:phage coat protein [Alphaproteobacteria bacterium]
VPMTGRIGGDALNYDGSTDLSTTGIETFLQSMIVIGRMKGWKERDFSYDITGGHDFMSDIANQVGEYWDDIDQRTILKILEGIFGVTTGGFSTTHTLDVTENSTGKMDATTPNTAMQLASGANKNIFTLMIMHSAVATNLENLEILDFKKGTEANGMQDLPNIGRYNGRIVLIDDDVPTETVAASGSTPAYTKYTTYILGRGAIDYCDCGAKVPYETDRNPVTNGGEEMLYTRQRKLFAPRGFSFVQPSTPIISPTDAQLATAARWSLVKDTAGTGYYDTKAIPIARIISKG